MARQAASRRTQCINNLKQIDLALQSYQTSYNTLPSGCYDPAGPVSSEPGGYKVGWMVSILPYMEQNGVYRAFDFRHGAGDPENATARITRINTLLLPERGGRLELPEPAGIRRGIPSTPGSTSYAGCQNDVEAPIDEDNHGVFYLNSRVRLVDVSDGLSNTIFVGEIAASVPAGLGLRDARHPAEHGPSDQRRDPVGRRAGPAGHGAAARRLSARSIWNGSSMRAAPRISPTFVGGFGSSHIGAGANFAFGDGSVRFLKQTIDQAVYRRLGHRSDGEPIDEDAY